MNIEEIMNKAVDKFLGWELPDFYPDGGITFKRIPNHKVTGTNLFSAQEAKQMFEYALTEALTTHTNALRIKLLEEVKSIKKPIPATHVCFESNITFVEETPASFMGALCLEGKITEQHALEIKNIIAAVIATSVRKERERVIKKLVDDGYLLGSEDVLKELSELNPPPERMKTLETKTIEHKGIRVTIKIDYDLGKASLLERTHQGNFTTKKWIFQDRGLEYMEGWKGILEAVADAVKICKKDLEADLAAKSAFNEAQVVALLAPELKKKK